MNRILTLLLLNFINTARCEEWEQTKIKDFKIEGGNVSNWIQKWIDESERSGAFHLGFKGVRYLYPLEDRDVGVAYVNASGASMINVLEYISNSCMFEYRIYDNYVIIQPDKRYKDIIVELDDKLLSGIGLDTKKPITKVLLAGAFAKLGIEIDKSPDSMTLLDGRAVISVIAIDHKLLESIIYVARSGLTVDVKSNKDN